MAKSRRLLEIHFGEHFISAVYNFSGGSFEANYKSKIKNDICDNSNPLWLETKKIMENRKQGNKRNNQEKFIANIVGLIYNFQIATQIDKLDHLISSSDLIENILEYRIRYLDKKDHYLEILKSEKKIKSIAESLKKEGFKRGMNIYNLKNDGNFTFLIPMIYPYYNNFNKLQLFIFLKTKIFYPYKSFEVTANLINVFIGKDLNEEWVNSESIEKAFRRLNKKVKKFE